MNYQEFSAKVKAKYPEYKDVDDRELADRIIKKYPEYKSQVTFDSAEPEIKKEGVGKKVLDTLKRGGGIPGNPIDLTQRIYSGVERTFNRGGELTAEKLGEAGVDPRIAAGAGTAISMAPEIATTIAAPISPKGATPEIAVDAARRALGFQKRMLKTPMAERSAQEAGKVALEKGIIPFFGDPKTMLKRAQDLEASSGSAIGDFLQSQGSKFDPNSMIVEFEALKKAMVPPAANSIPGQSYYKDIIRQINKAINTVKAHGDEPITFEQANEIKGIFQQAVNYNSDAGTQKLGRNIAGTARETVDSELGKVSAASGREKDFQKFQQDKKEYGAASRMQEAIQNKIAGEEGNMLFSLPSTIVAAGQIAAGNPLQAAASLGLAEFTKRRGSAGLANVIKSLSQSSRFYPAGSLGLRKKINREERAQ